jgi:hypothetical protein
MTGAPLFGRDIRHAKGHALHVTACMYTLIKVILLEMVCAAVHALKTLDINLHFNNLPRRHNRLCRQVVFVPWVVPRYLDPTPIYSNYSTACSKVHGSNSAWA